MKHTPKQGRRVARQAGRGATLVTVATHAHLDAQRIRHAGLMAATREALRFAHDYAVLEQHRNGHRLGGLR